MIQSFRHKGLEKFFTGNSKKGIQPEHAKKLTAILTALHAAKHINQIAAYEAFGLHPLKHWGTGLWAVKVSGNWRVTFVWKGEDAEQVDYVDYH
ncbi:MAG TPA: type II toxin-antitoxin system RelE/ParE family toxin [Acidobacteriaceae bacterium]